MDFHSPKTENLMKHLQHVVPKVMIIVAQRGLGLPLGFCGPSVAPQALPELFLDYCSFHFEQTVDMIFDDLSGYLLDRFRSVVGTVLDEFMVHRRRLHGTNVI